MMSQSPAQEKSVPQSGGKEFSSADEKKAKNRSRMAEVLRKLRKGK